jgi:hypothetical protein
VYLDWFDADHFASSANFHKRLGTA